MEVQLIDIFGSDKRVVDAARVSFDKIADNYADEQNEKLIKYLAKHNHWSPFAHVSITMRERVPIFVARQRFKHRIGFEYNEISRRYVDSEPEFFIPIEWRRRAENKKQGSSDEVIGAGNGVPFYIDEEQNEMYYPEFIQLCSIFYDSMIKKGVAPEQARMILPQSLYTEYYCTGSLAAWARAYKLRSDPHAQLEIQDLAKMWNEVISGIKELGYSWKALIE